MEDRMATIRTASIRGTIVTDNTLEPIATEITPVTDLDLFGWGGVRTAPGGGTAYSGNKITGTGGSDDLFGTTDNDHILGLDGDDFLYGLAGNDTLDGGTGVDVMAGGTGDDTYHVDNGGDIVFEFGGEGTDTIIAWSDYVLPVAVENLTLTGGIEGTGNSLDNTIVGTHSFNELHGLGGNDHLYGLGGRDRLQGDDGDDYLDGGLGNDALWGGRGRDTLVGGLDNDTFIWQSIDQTGITLATMDLILDFNFAEGDRINLSDIDADTYTDGNQAFSFIGAAGFSGTPGEINYYHSGGDTIIQMQTGMDADVEGAIRLSGIHTPDATWFVL